VPSRAWGGLDRDDIGRSARVGMGALNARRLSQASPKVNGREGASFHLQIRPLPIGERMPS
jgi:hypothetical protein